jgi:hypothetical protein
MEWVANFLELNAKLLSTSLGTGYSGYSDTELKEQAKSFAQEIETLLNRSADVNKQLAALKDNDLNNAKTDKDKKAVITKFQKLLDIEILKIKFEFYRKFEIDSSLLIKEIENRIKLKFPNTLQLSDPYEHQRVNNLTEMYSRAKLLQQMANRL